MVLRTVPERVVGELVVVPDRDEGVLSVTLL
jgi:hypothetical protein